MKKIFQEKILIDIPFHDIDIMNIVWHGYYVKYFEIARTSLMRALNMDWPWLRDQGVMMPLVHIDVDFIKPLRYGENPCIYAEISEYDSPVLDIDYAIECNGELRARAYTRQVYSPLSGESLYYGIPPVVLCRFNDYLDRRVPVHDARAYGFRGKRRTPGLLRRSSEKTLP